MRDRLVGIFFGIVVMWLVFWYVWPERAGAAMVQSLATTLRRMSELATGSGDTHRVRAAAWQALAQAERSAEFFAFEPEGLAPAGAEQAQRIRRLVELTRRVLLAQAALLTHRESTPSDTVDPAADGARAAFGHAIAAALASVAQQAETGFTSDHVDVRAPLAALEAQSRRGAVTVRLEGELGLCEAFVERVEALQRAAAPYEQRIPHGRSASTLAARCRGARCRYGERTRSESRPHDPARARSTVDRPGHRHLLCDCFRAFRRGAIGGSARARDRSSQSLRARGAHRHRAADQSGDARRVGARA